MKRLICWGVIENGTWRVAPANSLLLENNGEPEESTGRGLPRDFEGVSPAEASEILRNARAIAQAEHAAAVETILRRLCGTIIGLAEELDTRGPVEV